MKAVLRWLLKYLSISLVLIAIGVGLWFWAAYKYVYSSGERAGYVQKFSKKGWVFKTWEGELAMVNLPGAMPEKFIFSIVDPAVSARVTSTMGQRVVLKYEQHRFIPVPILAETEYFIIDVLPVQESIAPKPLPAVAPDKK
jgi:hypothetical protein